MLKSFDIGDAPLDGMIGREWLVANGIGGYASSTIPCLNTRKYHGLLVAAMAPPVRRMVLLSRVEDTVMCDGWPHALSSNEYPGTVHPEGYHALRAFSPEPFPRWAYQGENWTLQKELCLLRGRNTVCLTYTLLAGQRPVTLELRPVLALRPIHELSFQWNGRLITETRPGDRSSHRVPATTRTPEVFFAHTGTFEPQSNWYLNTIYRREQERGYAALEDVWSPGLVRVKLAAGESAHLVCSTDPFDLANAVAEAHGQGATNAKSTVSLAAAIARTGDPGPANPTTSPATEMPVSPRGDGPNLMGTRAISASPATGDAALLAKAMASPSSGPLANSVVDDLCRAAGQFIVGGGDTSAATTTAAGESTGVIGHYPWAAPSGRSALAGFAGLFLVTGRFQEGRALLLGMAARVDRGLMPSDFAEGGGAPAYHGADVSLWFANAVWAYLRYTRDEVTVGTHLLGPLLQVIEHYRRGTRLGISADDGGLLRTHAPGAATTWMDAKAGDWVITPRQGRPVEINALWHNAVCVAAQLAGRFGRGSTADDLSALSRLTKLSFNDRFWNPAAGCCYDVVSDRGPDPAVRPNQLLATSLPFPVLALDRHSPALECVMRDLRTPVGVRTLAPNDAGYCGRYAGNVIARDRAVHNGTAFPWLLGPLVTTYVRVHGRGEGARREAGELLQGCIGHLRGDGLGQIPETFDGDAPHAPGGAIASALSVAEVLRAYSEDVLDRGPAAPSGDGAVPAELETNARPTSPAPRP